MNWTEFLRAEIEETYGATEGLMRLVPSDRLGWTPATGENWMTLGQLLRHLTTACGSCCRELVAGEGGGNAAAVEEVPGSEAAFGPPAEALPTVASVAEARRRLAEDRALALETIERAGEDDLREKTIRAPWDPREKNLGRYLHEMVTHLATHKAQLFYYLKLLGMPMGTAHLWRMPGG